MVPVTDVVAAFLIVSGANLTDPHMNLSFSRADSKCKIQKIKSYMIYV